MPDGVLGRYTGANCSPAKRQAIKEQVLAGTPTHTIAETVGCSTSTVSVIRDQELPDWRKQASSGLKETASNLIQHFRTTDPAEIPWAVKPVMLGIVLDKIALLDGEPTQIVEHRHTIDMSGMLPPELQVLDVSEHNPDTAKALTAPDSPTIPKKTQG